MASEKVPRSALPGQLGSEGLTSRVVSLAAKAALNFYDLSGLIKTLHEADPSSLRMLPSETGISLRGFYYLLDVGRLVEKYRIGRLEAESVGSTKLQTIARHVAARGDASTEEVTTYLELARSTKAHLLRDTLRQGKVNPTRAVTFHLDAEDRSKLSAALLTYGAEPARKGLINRDKALMALISAALSKA